MKTILITGASGFLGWNLCRVAQKEWQVFGVVNSHRIDVPGTTVVECDLTDGDSVAGLFARIKPDAVVHAAAMADPIVCQQHPDDSHKINVQASASIARCCGDFGIPLVYVSTDLAFDGQHAPYREEDPASPISVYGMHKVDAERVVRAACPHAIVCRMPLMFGNPGPVAKSFIQPMMRAIEQGKELRLYIDEFRTPVGGTSAAQGILLALEKAKGILHCGGSRRISRYDIGVMLAKIMGRGARLVPVNQAETVMIAPRPPDVSLDSSKAFALGFRPKEIEEEMREAVAGE